MPVPHQRELMIWRRGSFARSLARTQEPVSIVMDYVFGRFGYPYFRIPGNLADVTTKLLGGANWTTISRVASKSAALFDGPVSGTGKRVHEAPKAFALSGCAAKFDRYHVGAIDGDLL